MDNVIYLHNRPRVKYGSRDYDRQVLMDSLTALADNVTDEHSLQVRWSCFFLFKRLNETKKERKKSMFVCVHSQDRDDIKYMIEIHNKGSSEKDVSEMLDLLDTIRSGGCNVLTFTIIRDPLNHAYSDFNFFANQYRFHRNFSQFIMEYVRRRRKELASKVD